MMIQSLMLLFVLGQTPIGDDGLLHEWTLSADKIKGQTLNADAGGLDATITGPVKFAGAKPHALLFDGNSKAKHGIEITKNIKDAGLPDEAISVEAWVRVDETHERGGIIGAFQHNGPYQKGWLLGFNHSQFSWAVAGKNGKGLTYLKPKTHVQTGFWYHLVGTYDGKEQKLYINGKLAAVSKQQSGPIDYPPRAIYSIGVYRDDDEHFTLKGQIERVSVFKTVLDAERVAARFKARKNLFPDMDAVPPQVTDWPTYLRDNLRTGAAPEAPKLPLHLKWTHKARFPPAPAWPSEAKQDFWHQKYSLEDIVTFDRGFQLVSVGDRVYFGSSEDDRVYCLDADTGKTHWSYCTEGPVRLAPTISDGKVLFGSDDGEVYCLKSEDGFFLWKTRLAPTGRRIPGNGRIISAWPVRSGVLVEGNKAYACAGIFPSQGVYQCTLDVRDGHIDEKKPIGLTAQGYMERRNGQLMIATGRNQAGAFVAKLERLGREIDKEVAALPKDYPHAFISAAGLRFAGGDGKIAAFRAEDGTKVWDAKVEGKVQSLIVVRGRLFASTDMVFIYCFDDKENKPGIISPAPPSPPQHPDKATRDFYELHAKRLLSESGAKKGYALILDGVGGLLAYEIAKRSDLQVICIPRGDLASAREFLEAAGVSNRVIVHARPEGELPYADYTFNLVEIDPGIRMPIRKGWSDDDIQRVLRPYGGYMANLRFDRPIIKKALDGEGEWTHQYGDAGNTSCSGDNRIEGELQLQWFGKPGPREMIDRHHRTAAPLYKQGRLFVPGEDRVVAVDAYNGTILWDREFAGSKRVIVFRDASFLAHGSEHLFLAMSDHCLALDPQTGETARKFDLPKAAREKKMEWDYLATVGDTVVGSASKPGSIRRTQSLLVDRTETYYDYVPVVCSDLLFAHDSKTGKELWSYQARGLIPNPAIALSADSVFFLESGDPETLKRDKSRARMRDLFAKKASVVALDLRDGTERWRQEIDLSFLDHIVYLACAKNRLIISGSLNSARDKKVGKVQYDLHALDAKTGKELWFKSLDTGLPIAGDHGEQDQHPVIVDGKVYQEPFAYNLESGEEIAWKWPWARGKRRPGCGAISASASKFFFRSETAGMFDLLRDEPKKLTTETRPGCWINLIPAGGLVLAPEASSGCTCGFSVQTSLALIPVRRGK